MQVGVTMNGWVRFHSPCGWVVDAAVACAIVPQGTRHRAPAGRLMSFSWPGLGEMEGRSGLVGGSCRPAARC